MTSAADVKKVLNGLIQDGTVKRLKNDESFLETVAMLYDEYIEESKAIGIKPQWDLERYVLDKVEWEENN